jgi:hypothetical protein
MTQDTNCREPWPLWRKVLFRFCFIYLLLQVLARPFFDNAPVLGLIGKAQNFICFTGVNAFAKYILNIPQVIQPVPGSSDGLFNWIQLVFFLTLAVVGTLVWSIINRKQNTYHHANYYLTTVLRYTLAYTSFIYGIIKLYMLQMHFPRLTDMATPVGDLDPLKLSWLFVGYSAPYQFFSGLMEFTVALLLVYKRTATLGALIGLTVYVNVFMINFGYNIPVKLYSLQLILMCLYLLSNDLKRLTYFFILNKPIAQKSLLSFVPSKTGRVLKLGLKIVYFLDILYLIVGPYGAFTKSKAESVAEVKPIPYGLYEVNTFIKNGDTLPVLANDSLVWKDIIFERGSKYATINSKDTLFTKKTGRGVFSYTTDTLKNAMQWFRYKGNKRIIIANIRYKLSADKMRVKLWAKLKSDSVSIDLIKSDRKFNLDKKEFQWIKSR